MFVTEVNGTRYRVCFKHSPNDKPPHTECTVYWKTTEQEESQVTASVRLFHRDRWCKATGRKASLTRALKSLGLGKPERTVFWKTYLATGANAGITA